MTVTVETHATVSDAQRALGSDAVYLGGGTIVMRGVNGGTLRGRVVRCVDPTLRRIGPAGNALEIGAGVTMAALLARAEAAFLHPVARAVGGPQVRNMATIGGNLFARAPYGDFACALLALGARAVMAGGTQRPVDDVLRDGARAGLVAAVTVPRPKDPRAFAYLKVSRVKPKGVSVMSIAALLPRDSGRLRGVRVAYLGFGPGPVRAAAVERVLEGATLDAPTLARAAQVAAEGLEASTDALATAWYRREVAGVHLRRLLERMA
jgi:CO/xanthine dehydrogenase FAD-binding subunit